MENRIRMTKSKCKTDRQPMTFNAGKTFPTKDGKQSKITMENSVIFGSDKTGSTGKQLSDVEKKGNRDGGHKTGSTDKQLSDFENKGNRDKGVKTGSTGKQLSDFENKGHSLNDKTEMQQSEENYPGSMVLKLYPDFINLPNNEADPTADCKSSMETGLFSKPDTAKGWPGAQIASGATGHTDLSVVSTGEKRIVGKMKYPGYADKESRPSGTHNETDVALVNLTRGSIGDITNGEISFSNPTDFTREYTKAYDRDHRKTGDYEDTDMKGRSSRTYTETDVYKFSTHLHNSQMSTGTNVSKKQNVGPPVYKTTYSVSFKDPLRPERREYGSSVDRAQPQSWEFFTERKKISIQVMKSDITTQQVDAIFNAANGSLKHGGGVARAGSELQMECTRFIKDGDAIPVTGLFVSCGGKLPAKHVIHAVGPKWSRYGEEKKEECARDLRRTVLRCLVEADQRGLRSVALPSICTGEFEQK